MARIPTWWFDDPVRVQVLGPLEVEVQSGPARLAGARVRDALAVLVERRGREVAPDCILDLVWGDAAPSLTTAAVHTVIARLRRALGPGAVLTGERGYCLASHIEVDADEHDALLRAAHDLRAGGRAADAADRYRAALALWRGPTAYEGVNDDVALADRARLREVRAAAGEGLAECLLELGGMRANSEAANLAARLMSEFPFREAPVQLAMRAAYALGRQAEALETYAQLRSRLREELGIDPSPQTQAVHAEILAQEEPLAEPGIAVPQRTRTRLPLPPTPTLGRQDELAELRSWYGERHRLLTLVGPGGVGKSRLLQEFGHTLPDRDVMYLDLSGTSDASPQRLAETILLAHGLRVTTPDALAGLTAALAGARLTLLLDEAERSLEGVVEIVGEVLARCAGVRLLVASRAPLGVAGERRLPVSPLPCPDSDTGGAAARAAPAVILLEARLRDHAPDLVVRDADGALLARLAQRVDGLPLGLELVASQAATRSLIELDELFGAPLDLTHPSGAANSRHRSLRRALAWSAVRLAPQQAVAFRRLGAFAGSFSAGAATAIIAEPGAETALRTLARDGLLQLDRRGPRVRFRMLRTMRDLALEELEREGETGTVRRRHRAWFAARWRGTSFHDEMLFDIGECYDDYLAALEDALAVGDGDSAAGLSVSLGWFWVFHEAPSATPWFDVLLSSGLLTGVDLGRVALFRRAMDAAFAAHPPGPDSAAIRRLLAGDPEWEVLGGLVDVLERYVAGDVPGAHRRAERVLELAAAQAPHHVPEALATAAVMRAAAGRTTEALAAAEESWQMIGTAPGVLHLSAVVAKVGLALMDAGQPSRALAVLTRAIESVDRRFGVAVSNTLLVNAGWAALSCDEPRTAARWFDRALQRRQGLVEGHLAEAASGGAAVLSELGVPGAQAHVAAAAELCRRHGLTLCPWLVTALERIRERDHGGPAVAAVRDDELAEPIIDAVHEVACAPTEPGGFSERGLDTPADTGDQPVTRVTRGTASS